MQASSAQHDNECAGNMYHMYKLAARVASCLVPSLGTVNVQQPAQCSINTMDSHQQKLEKRFVL